MPRTVCTAAVVVAAGRGERAGHSPHGPKQYRLIGGRPVLAWTLDLFLAATTIDRIVVVIHPDDHDLFDSVRSYLDGDADILVVDGAETRQGSVLRGLEALTDSGTVAVMIHDGDRPFVPVSLIESLSEGLNSGVTALLPAMPVTDTLKRANHNSVVEETVPRAGLFGAQTPQCFAFEAILDAHRSAARSTGIEFTDDCSVAEWAGMSVAIVPGSPDNIKLTTARDMAMADEKLTTGRERTMPDIRTGNGYDVHALKPGDGVVLCGVFIPHDQALLGHSDADVALHSLTDALLATCGAGDIGDYFPPDDPQWKDAPSHLFLKHASDILHRHGGTVMNADVTLICEAPRIGPHRQAMRKNLAEILGIEVERCSVKATTNEKIGFVGRREGIAAIATATVAYRNDEP